MLSAITAVLLSVVPTAAFLGHPALSVSAAHARAHAARMTSPAGTQFGTVLCAGLACLDMQLLGASVPETPDSMATFRGCVMKAGGSAPNTAAALRTLGVPVAVLSQAGEDSNGEEIVRQLEACGVDTALFIRPYPVTGGC
jgi:bifunctional ADP-heptose synthase (sugar kinase/adenylyltransferase)